MISLISYCEKDYFPFTVLISHKKTSFAGIELDEEEEIRLAKGAPIDAWVVTKTCLPLTELMNSTLSDNISVQDDFVAYKVVYCYFNIKFLISIKIRFFFFRR